MRVGRFISIPGDYSQYAKIKDDEGNAFTVDIRQQPTKMDPDKNYAFEVDLWQNDGGLAYNIKED